MKKIAIIFLSLFIFFGLCSCDFSFDGNKGEIIANLTQLPVPEITEVRENYVYWNEVPNANSYVIKINNNQESAGNSLKYSLSSIMDSQIDYNVPTELHIYVKAKGNQTLYSDSEWSSEFVYTYTKIKNDDSEEPNKKIQIGFNDTYKSNGLGRTIDLINANSFQPKSGVGYIFNEADLFSRTLLAETIRDQKATYQYGTSFDEFYSKWKVDMGLKVANNHLGINGANFLPGTADFSVEVKGGYERVEKSSTKELYIKMHHNIVGKSVELFGHLSDYDYYSSILSQSFKDSARKVVDEKTAEAFINSWGTHVIMAAYYGAAFEASYYNISHDKYLESNWYVDVETAVKSHLFFSDLNTNLNFDLDRDANDNSKTSLTNFEAHAVGGNGTALASDLASFQKSYEAWANGLNESNYTLVDVPNNSLYCIWDFLDDSYSSQKEILNNYFLKACNDKLLSIKDKINGIYSVENDVDPEVYPINNELVDFSFPATIKTESTVQGKVDFNVIGTPVIYKGEEYIFGNAYYAGQIAGGTRFNDVSSLSFNCDDTVVLFGGTIGWYGTKGDSNESGNAGWDSTYQHNVSEVYYMHRRPNCDFAGDENVYISIIGICVKTNRVLDEKIKYPEIIEESFITSLKTENINQGRVKFEMYGIKVIYKNAEYLYGCAYASVNSGGSRLNNVAQIEFSDSTKEILQGGMMIYQGKKDDFHTCGFLTGQALHNEGNNCIYMTENGDDDFPGDEKITYNITNICVKLDNTLKENYNYIRLADTKQRINIYAESSYKDSIDLSFFGLRLTFNGEKVLFGYSNYIGAINGSRLNDCDSIKLVYEEGSFLMGGHMLYSGNYDDWNTQNNLYSNDCIKTNTIIYYAYECADDFPGNDAKQMIISAYGMCIFY